uniref:perlucin-like protein n=1 Tax=Styela clava TaxID=7725 RepID=UPI001939E147|nr:perlucin-like protein [Styela clava]
MNAFGISSLYIITSIILGVSNAQIPWTTKCVNQYELTFFNDTRKNYDGAKAACESLRGYLAKVDNERMTYVINATFELDDSINTYFIGGNDRTTEGYWKWQDGTDVNMREGVGYQNWRHGQPNNYGAGEDCLMVGINTYHWVDSRCGDKLFYICQSG